LDESRVVPAEQVAAITADTTALPPPTATPSEATADPVAAALPELAVAVAADDVATVEPAAMGMAAATPSMAVAAVATEAVVPTRDTAPPATNTALPVAAETAHVSPVTPAEAMAIDRPMDAAPRPAPTKPKPRQSHTEPIKPKPTPSKPRPQPAATGSGGKSEADARAAAPARGGAGRLDAGGSAAESRYPGLVQAKLRRVLRFPPGADRAGAEVHVRFTVLADGEAAGIAVVSSSGSALLDQAAIDTVHRASPFPPIPAEAGRSSWAFTMPLRFRR
jgi:protein TonB